MHHFLFDKSPSRLSLVAGLVLLATAANAQSSDCQNLQAALAALGPSDPARSAQFTKAVQKQQYELDRTVAYAHSIGCDNRQFLFFGQAPPPQCGEIGVRIQRMQANLTQLQAEADRASGEARRRDLTARFNSYCRGGQQQARGFFDNLFGGGAPRPPLSPLPDDQAPPVAIQDDTPRGGSKAVCVRTCDGGFFPVSYSATRGRLESLAQQCQALCPNAETALYTYSPSKDIDQAVSIDGKPYTELPNAGKFRTKFDPTCTCKPAGESWADALAGAERALGHESASDVIVTPEKSAEMARPKPVAKGKGKPDPKSRDAPPSDDATAADGLAAQQVPTASNESAGIGPKTSIGGPAYGLSQGQTREETGPDGVKKKVRIIGPTVDATQRTSP